MNPNRRILVVDDMPSIHEDFRRILMKRPEKSELVADEAILFGAAVREPQLQFELDSAYQGREALDKVVQARASETPYALAIVDMRMPPGWDGLETIEQLWLQDKDLQIVICTAYSDVPWENLLERLDARDRLAVLKKPFDAAEALELADTLTTKWAREREQRSD